MAEKKFSELTSAATLTGSELVAVSQDQSGSLISAKTTTQGLSNFTAITAQYSSALQTTNKTICGAINEAAQSGGDTVTVTNTIPATSLTKKVADVNINGTPTAINADDALAVIKDVFGTDHTVEGNPVTFDAWTGIETVKACSVDLLPIQDLHGYDSPWVGGAGKNKFNIDGFSDTQRTVVASVNNGVLHLQGTVTAGGNARFALPTAQSIPTGSVTLSVSGSNENIRVTCQGNNGFTYTSFYGNSSKTFTITDTVTLSYFYVDVTDGTTVNADVKIQIESGSQATTFAPYSNICPISGRTQASVTRTGKNLAKTLGLTFANPSSTTYSNATPRTFTANSYFWGLTYNNYFNTAQISNNTYSNGVFEFTSGAGAYGANIPIIGLLVGKTYTISAESTNGVISVSFYDKSGNYMSNVNTASFTVPENTYYSVICLRVNANNATATFKNIQIELGSTATAYEPYNGQTYTESLGSTYYGGKVDFTSGKLTVDKVYYEYDGSNDENWDKTTSSGNPVVRTPKPSGIKSNDTAYTACNMLTRTTNSTQIYVGKFYMGGSNLVIGYDDTLENWKSFIGTTHLQFVFELETPQEITLTPQEIELLKGQNVLWSDSNGNIKLTYSADIKAFIESQLQNS